MASPVGPPQFLTAAEAASLSRYWARNLLCDVPELDMPALASDSDTSSSQLSRTPPPCGSKRRPSSPATNLTKYIQQCGYASAPSPSCPVKVSADTFLDADSADRQTMEVPSGSSSEGEASLVLPGEAKDGIEVLTVPSCSYDSDDSDADINELLLPAPLVGELEGDDELFPSAPLVGEHEQATRVEWQGRGLRHAHYLFGEL